MRNASNVNFEFINPFNIFMIGVMMMHVIRSGLLLQNRIIWCPIRIRSSRRSYKMWRDIFKQLHIVWCVIIMFKHRICTAWAWLDRGSMRTYGHVMDRCPVPGGFSVRCQWMNEWFKKKKKLVASLKCCYSASPDCNSGF